MENEPLNNEKSKYQGRDTLEELLQPKRGRKKRSSKNLGRLVNFNCSWELDARLDSYRANRKRKEERVIERTEVIVQALDEFLTGQGYPPTSEN